MNEAHSQSSSKIHVLENMINISDVNISGLYGVKPLHVAAKFDSIEVARLLLKHHADVLCRDCKQKTPLHYAARKGHAEMVQVSDFDC